MASRFVRQPDGKLARWSDVVDAFTHFGMTQDEAVELAREDAGRNAAEAKIQRAVDDEEPWKIGVRGNGLSRWRHCLATLVDRHGVDRAREDLAEMGFPEAVPTPTSPATPRTAPSPAS